MTEDEYIPIELTRGEYAKVTEPLTDPQILSGKEILLDSIYSFECQWDELAQSYGYNFEQLYKGVTYVTLEGVFVSETMGPSEPGGVPLSGIYLYFLTKEGDKIMLASDYDYDFSGRALGGWTLDHMYYKDWNDTEKITPDTLYMVRFIKLEEGYYKGCYIPVQLLGSRPTSITTISSTKTPLINVQNGKLLVQSTKPIIRVVLTSVDGVAITYGIDNQHEVVLSCPLANQPAVIQIDFTDGSTSYTQKIILKGER